MTFWNWGRIAPSALDEAARKIVKDHELAQKPERERYLKQLAMYNAGVPGTCHPDHHYHPAEHLEADLLQFQKTEQELINEICGYCGRIKRRGAWCPYARCESNLRHK